MRSTPDEPNPLAATGPQAESPHTPCESSGPGPSSERVLLVDSEETLTQTRTLLFQSLGKPVDVAPNLAAIWNLSRETPYCLVAVSLTSKLADLPAVLTAIRNLWPAARILLLGNQVEGVDDHQYDEMVDAAYRPRELIDMARRLLSPHPYVTAR